MCCFSRPVQSVSATKIFARDAGNGKQFLVYSMNYRAGEDLAMVLPLPVPPASKEDAVQFVDLHEYEGFFRDLESGFPQPQPVSRSRSIPTDRIPAAAPLAVVSVGSFEASFVPQVKDFARLDPRFRMPDGVWDKLPQYKQAGFAVFKLKQSASQVHPMAFVFPRADATKLFFPTVHIHDGKVHDKAGFDHSLYCQVGHEHSKASGWAESPQLASSFVNISKSKGIIDGGAHCYKRELHGQLKNQDTYL